MKYQFPIQTASPPGGGQSKMPVQSLERDNLVTRHSGASANSTLLVCEEVAKRLRCSKGQLSKVIQGKIKSLPRLNVVRLGRRVLVREEALEQWIREVERCNADR
jgi:excisionase family DNA binding protein